MVSGQSLEYLKYFCYCPGTIHVHVCEGVCWCECVRACKVMPVSMGNPGNWENDDR